jgi:hypothetical protein
MESRKTDIFSTCVFINLENLSLNFHSPFFFHDPGGRKFLTALFSIIYVFGRFPRFIANIFRFCCIMESRFLFFVLDPVFKCKSPCLKDLGR